MSSTYTLVDTPEALDSLVQHLKETQPKQVALDFEGESNRHRYGIHLCLIQLYYETHFFVIDPMVLDDISPLRFLFEHEDIEKVMYAADFDVRLFAYTQGYPLQNIFDVRLGAMLLDWPKNNLPYLIERCIIGVEFQKKSKLQKANWNTRPLERKLLDYALDDVRYLLDVRTKVLDELQAQPHLLTGFYRKQREAENARFQVWKEPHMRLRHAPKLRGSARIFLKHFYATREFIAKELDIPPYWVLANPDLIQLAKNPPSDWSRIKFPRRTAHLLHLWASSAKLARHEAAQAASQSRISAKD